MSRKNTPRNFPPFNHSSLIPKPVSHGHNFGTMFQLVHYRIENTVLPFCIIELGGAGGAWDIWLEGLGGVGY